MKFNLNNPAFLQMAGSVQAKEYITMVYSKADQSARISTDGDLLVSTIKNGQTITANYSNLNDTTISFDADANSLITLSGKVTALSAGNGPFLFDNLVELDLRAARSLTYLKCNRGQLTSLDVSNNTALKYLNCDNNQLTSLDVSKNTALTELNCNNNQLTSLDVSKNTALTSLGCDNNQLTSLDVSNNTALKYLNCDNNQLTSLDVSENTALIALGNSGNPNIVDIQSVAVNSSVASAIAGLINSATSTTGTVTLRNGDQYNSTISDAATTKGWTVEYVDA